MANRRKSVMIIFGTRPEAIKLAPIIKAIKEKSNFISLTVTTSQHRKLQDDVLELFDIKSDFDLNIMTENQSLPDVVIRSLPRLYDIISKCKPDLVIVQGDTTSAFIGALAGFYHRVPVAHIEAGLRTYDKYNPFPEEMNRHLISIIADLHFAPTYYEKQKLLKENIPSKNIFIVGNPVVDALFSMCTRYKKKGIENERLKFLLRQNRLSRRLILVTAHRRENWGTPLREICSALLHIAKKFKDINVIYPVHPHPNVRETVNRALRGVSNIHLLEPLIYSDFVNLLSRAYLVLTDSGGIQEEATALGVPALVLRQKTERQVGLDKGPLKLIGTESRTILKYTEVLLMDRRRYLSMHRASNIFGDGRASQRIVDIIENYLERKIR